jgi:hypothetical protein
MAKKKLPPRLYVEKLTVTLSLPVSTDQLLDKASEATGINRSAYAGRAILEQAQRDGIAMKKE